jgi:hypothetical protein
MYLQFISITLLFAASLGHGHGGPGGIRKEPQSCITERDAHKACITNSLGFAFDPAKVQECFATCTMQGRTQPNRRGRRGAHGGGGAGGRFQMGSKNVTAMMEQMACIEAAMSEPMDTCLKQNGVSFTLVTPTINASMAGPPMGKHGGGKHGGGRHNPAQELLMIEQRAAACGVTECVRTAMGGHNATELKALLCTADTTCPKPASDSQCKQDRDVLKKALCVCQQTLSADFQLAAANCGISGVTTPVKQQRNCTADSVEFHSNEADEADEGSPFCQTTNSVPTRFQQGTYGARPQFGGQGRPNFSQGQRPQFGGQQGGGRPFGGQQGGGRPFGGRPQEGETTTTEAPVIKRRSF